VVRPRRERNRELTERYRTALARVSAILLRTDPIGIGDAAPSDEYAPEAQRILARADEAGTPTELGVIVREVFGAQFGETEARAGLSYADIGRELWPAVESLWDKPSD
jgi:hypothetical protein